MSRLQNNVREEKGKAGTVTLKGLRQVMTDTYVGQGKYVDPTGLVIPIREADLDRIEPSKGYNHDEIRPLWKPLKRLRGDDDTDDSIVQVINHFRKWRMMWAPAMSTSKSPLSPRGYDTLGNVRLLWLPLNLVRSDALDDSPLLEVFDYLRSSRVANPAQYQALALEEDESQYHPPCSSPMVKKRTRTRKRMRTGRRRPSRMMMMKGKRGDETLTRKSKWPHNHGQ